MPAESQLQLGNVVEVRVLSGVRSGEQFWFFDAERVRMGRNPSNDVVIPDGGVSRFHAELLSSDGSYRLCDLGSMAGTYLIGGGLAQRLNQDAPVMLAFPGGHEMSFGRGGPRCRISLGVSVPFGRYRLIARIGGGGMAEVFLARQTGLGGFNRPVALKLIQPEMFDLVDATSMFLDEARIAAEINHHNVVKIYDIGEQDGVLFLAMEHLRGATLSHMSAQLHQRGERMPPDLVAALLSQACAGLHAAHSLRDPSGRLLNVVHRDVSPSNLMCTSEGLIKVIDFGVARADVRLVRKEEGLQGKPAYMSPEQIQSQPLDARSDVFAVGVVLYELCSGQPLFQRDEMIATFYAVVRDEVPPLRSVCPQASPLLEMVVHKALAKDPNQRFQSCADLAAELDQVVIEAGGRFSNISAVARFLSEWGISLSGSPPVLLSQVPKPLLLRRSRGQSGDGHKPLPSTPTPMASPLAAPAPALVATLEPPKQLRPGAPSAQQRKTTAPVDGPPPAPPPPREPLKISPPPAGQENERCLRTASGGELRLSTLSVRMPRQHTPLALAMSSVEGLLPSPVGLIAQGTTLMAELAGGTGNRGRDRPSIYQDALDPNTRCESYTLLPTTPAASFDVGHRRMKVQRLSYASVMSQSKDGEALKLSMSDVGGQPVEIDAPGPLRRLCVLHTTAERGVTYMVCVLIEP